MSVLKSQAKLSFGSLGLSDWLRQQCKVMGIGEPTSVQYNCIPPILEGRDVIGCARTGTGKTLAFALPILQKLAEDPYGVFALVLTPTRELAYQIADQFRVIGKPIGLRDCVIVGGRDMIEQAKDMAQKPHVIISTPGRLADHIDSGCLEKDLFRKIRFLVFDEADRLLDGQYEQQLKMVLSAVPTKRQTLLFSATINDALSRLNDVAVKKPFFWEDKDDGTEALTVSLLDQRYVLCPIDFKDAYLVYVVKLYVDANPTSSVLIFCQTCRECQALTLMFRQLGFGGGVAALHSMIPQKERLTALARFRSNRLKILLCTDVAARGLDIPTVDMVINHNVPRMAKNYVHRVGRAARAGRSGRAVTFVTQYDVGLLKSIEKLIRTTLQELKVSDKKVSEYVAEVLVAKKEAEVRLDEQNFGEAKEINKRKQMILEGLDPKEVEKEMQRRKKRRKDDSRRRTGDDGGSEDVKKQKRGESNGMKKQRLGESKKRFLKRSDDKKGKRQVNS